MADVTLEAQLSSCSSGEIGKGQGIKIMTNVFWLAVPAVLGLSLLLFSEHRQHVLDFLPFLILLAYPLMHLFIRHGPSSGARHDPTHG